MSIKPLQLADRGRHGPRQHRPQLIARPFGKEEITRDKR